MSRDFTHLLLTRFNTAVAFAPSPIRLDTQWLTSRLGLFEQYCLSSVRSQQNASFHWLVFFDAASPAWFKERIRSLAAVFTPIYIEGRATDEVIAAKVAATGLVSTPYLITTRLDNDDAIGKNHLAQVQKAFCRQERQFVAFPFGLQSYRGHLYNMYWPSNPFLSLIEAVSPDNRFTTVFCVPHNLVHQAGAVRSIIQSPQWLQVVHGSNLLNVLGGWPRLKSRSHPDFDVVWPAVADGDSLAARTVLSARFFYRRASKLGKRVSRPTSQPLSEPR
jgi:hypothetical protein